jgi:hypothetical protein
MACVTNFLLVNSDQPRYPSTIRCVTGVRFQVRSGVNYGFKGNFTAKNGSATAHAISPRFRDFVHGHESAGRCRHKIQENGSYVLSASSSKPDAERLPVSRFGQDSGKMSRRAEPRMSTGPPIRDHRCHADRKHNAFAPPLGLGVLEFGEDAHYRWHEILRPGERQIFLDELDARPARARLCSTRAQGAKLPARRSRLSTLVTPCIQYPKHPWGTRTSSLSTVSS